MQPLMRRGETAGLNESVFVFVKEQSFNTSCEAALLGLKECESVIALKFCKNC